MGVESILSVLKQRGLAMYALIIVIAVVGGTATPVGVGTQVVGKFKNLDQCKAATNQPNAGGAISDLNLARGVYWYCIYTGAE
jgi:hypothetical protein